MVVIPHFLALNSITAGAAEAISTLSVEFFFVVAGFACATSCRLRPG
jgi:hypothetical protein